MAMLGGVALVRDRNRGDRLYHERFLAGYVAGETWIVVTPDMDSYPEDLSDLVNLADVRYRPRYGVLPVGLPAGTEVYAFDPDVEPNQGRRWLVQGRLDADNERRRRRLAILGDADLPPLAP